MPPPVPARPPLAAACRPALGLILAWALAGCATLDGLIGQARVEVLGGQVTVAAPQGYCVGPGAVEETQDTAVVLMGRCLATGLVAPAVISVSVGRSGSAGVMLAGAPALAAFLGGEAGRALLARSGRAEDVALLGTEDLGDALLVHLSDAELGDYWRAILAVQDRLVTISATGAQGVPLAEAASRRAVEQSLRALRRANGGAGQLAWPAPALPPPADATTDADRAGQPPPDRPAG